MPIDIIDNHRYRVVDCVRDLLTEDAVSVRLMVGYLFLDGLTPLCDALQRIPEIEILIGNVVNRLTQEQIQEERQTRLRGGESLVQDQADVAATLRDIHDRAAMETALNLRRTIESLPRSADTCALLLTLATRIADGGLKVRLYADGRIHAKLSLVEYRDDLKGVAVVGSSNLTVGGAGHPTELNVLIGGSEKICYLRQWYQDLWDVSQDFHRELFDELGQSWAMEPESARI